MDMRFWRPFGTFFLIEIIFSRSEIKIFSFAKYLDWVSGILSFPLVSIYNRFRQEIILWKVSCVELLEMVPVVAPLQALARYLFSNRYISLIAKIFRTWCMFWPKNKRNVWICGIFQCHDMRYIFDARYSRAAHHISDSRFEIQRVRARLFKIT